MCDEPFGIHCHPCKAEEEHDIEENMTWTRNLTSNSHRSEVLNRCFVAIYNIDIATRELVVVSDIKKVLIHLAAQSFAVESEV